MENKGKQTIMEKWQIDNYGKKRKKIDRNAKKKGS